MSRSAVWRWTQRLRALGVRVKGHPRTGYQIERVPDVLSPSLLRRRLRGSPFGKRIYHYFKAGSTNASRLELGHAGEPHGAVVLAEEQTARTRPCRALVALGKDQRHLRHACCCGRRFRRLSRR